MDTTQVNNLIGTKLFDVVYGELFRMLTKLGQHKCTGDVKIFGKYSALDVCWMPLRPLSSEALAEMERLLAFHHVCWAVFSALPIDLKIKMLESFFDDEFIGEVIAPILPFHSDLKMLQDRLSRRKYEAIFPGVVGSFSSDFYFRNTRFNGSHNRTLYSLGSQLLEFYLVDEAKGSVRTISPSFGSEAKPFVTKSIQSCIAHTIGGEYDTAFASIVKLFEFLRADGYMMLVVIPSVLSNTLAYFLQHVQTFHPEMYPERRAHALQVLFSHAPPALREDFIQEVLTLDPEDDLEL